MEVYCVFKSTYDEPELINIFDLEYVAKEHVDLMNSVNKTEDYYLSEWYVCP